MDDFLGTAIQHSEAQIKLLEAEHASKVEQTVQRLIDSGFLDSDYEGSSGNSTDFDPNDIQNSPPNATLSNLCLESDADSVYTSIHCNGFIENSNADHIQIPQKLIQFDRHLHQNKEVIMGESIPIVYTFQMLFVLLMIIGFYT
eukprot:37570_1